MPREYTIPKKRPSKQEIIEKLKAEVKRKVDNSAILLHAKRTFDPKNPGTSFIAPYIKDYHVYDEDGKRVWEPKAGIDIYMLPGDSGKMWTPQQWGVRLTEHDEPEDVIMRRMKRIREEDNREEGRDNRKEKR
jgi:hypothetical protein